jgi:hypothetical protein
MFVLPSARHFGWGIIGGERRKSPLCLFFKKKGTLFGQSREDLLNPNFYHWKQKEHLFVSSSLFHFSFLVVLNEEGNTREKGVKNERRRVLRTLV